MPQVPLAHDPLLRWLRIIAALSFLGMVLLVVLDPDRSGNLPLVALLSGSLLLQLGYEVVVPGLIRRGNGSTAKGEDDDTRDR